MRVFIVFAALVLLCLCLAACGGWHLPSFGFDSGVGGSGQPKSSAGGGILTSKEELGRTLTQLQWVFVGLGICGVVASFFVPLISTRHAVGAIVVGVGVAIAKPFVLALYWPTVICLFLAGLAAVWPYAVAVYGWARARFTGQPLPVATVGIAPSLKSLVMPRAKAVGARFPAVPDGSGTSGDNLGVS